LAKKATIFETSIDFPEKEIDFPEEEIDFLSDEQVMAKFALHDEADFLTLADFG